MAILFLFLKNHLTKLLKRMGQESLKGCVKEIFYFELNHWQTMQSPFFTKAIEKE
jgi:hypothetical protein